MVIAWLLAVVLATPLITKTIHSFEDHCLNTDCSHADDGNHAKHDCNTCLICKFIPFSFIEVSPTVSQINITVIETELFIAYQGVSYHSAPPLFHLRAPPAG